MPDEPDNSFEKTVRIHRPDDRLFDRFVLKRRLGQGGMGVVWLARDERLEIDVALKVLPDALRFDEGALAQLKQEAQKCIRLTHARIIRVFDFLVSDELAAISMEYVDGPTLAKLRAEQPEGVFAAEEIKDWVTQIGEALIHAHEEARIVHRDLKPGNVMIDIAGRAKVADFGIARTLGGTMTATSQNEFVTGTLAYMGPQQLRGDRPTAQDDIYALGALIYELLTGKPPFYSGDVCQQIETQQAPPLEQRRQELKHVGNPIPANWNKTILACLAKKPEERPASVRDLLTALDLNSEAPPATSARTAGSGLLLGGVVALVILLIAGVVQLQRQADTADDVGVSPGDAPGRASTAQTSPPPPPQSRFTNSLGMEFVSIPGLDVHFAAHETTVGDFALFVKASGHDADSDVYRLIDNLKDLERHRQETGDNPPDDVIHRQTPYYGRLGGWRDTLFEQSDRDPVVGMNLGDAMTFCAWLTARERKTGRIPEDFEYTLPSDHEWSVAAGLKDEPEDSAPRDRHRASVMAELGNPKNFPFGELTAPPATLGNYRGDADDFGHTAPVGSFPANEFGLFDLGGNASEWCRDLYDDTLMYGVIRGGNWRTSPDALVELASSHRNTPKWSKPDRRDEHFGFRCILRQVKATGEKPEK